MTTTTPAPEVSDEISTLEGAPEVIHLEGADKDVLLEEMRTRQIFKFLRILTTGAGPMLSELRISKDTPEDEITGQILGLLVVAVPEAENEVIEFLQSMVKPVGLIEPVGNKEQQAHNVQLYTELFQALENPKPEDTIDILVKIVTNEAPNMVALGKKLAALIPSVAKLIPSSKKSSKKPTRSAS